MKFQFLPENFSRSENAPPFETRKIRLFEVERIFLKNKKMLEEKETLTVRLLDAKTNCFEVPFNRTNDTITFNFNIRACSGLLIQC